MSHKQEYIVKEIPCGMMKGVKEDKVIRFLGVPFAKAKRFAYPEEVTKWEGTFQALEYGDAPWQSAAFPNNVNSNFYQHETKEGIPNKYSDDCLNLNIWMPENAKNAPVLIVIYGGGLTEGANTELQYDATSLAKKGIITVFLSYRVNIFGFIALPELAERDGRTGNYGFFDQQMGIEWVRHNIKSLGGNPDNMTLAGQSAGAASCEAQIKSPLNKGYFKQAFIQSSAGFTTVMKAKDNTEKEYKKWHKIYKASGVNSLDEFIQLPAEELFRLFEEARVGSMNYCTTLYDKEFGSEQNNQSCDTKIMMGVTAQDVFPVVLYFVSGLLAKNQRKIDIPTWRYYFKRQLPGDENGAWHGSDLWYFYGAMNRCWRPFTEEDYHLSQIMQDYAVNFMKTGNPNGGELEKWYPVGDKRGDTMVFDINLIQMGRPSLFSLIKNTFFAKKMY